MVNKEEDNSILNVREGDYLIADNGFSCMKNKSIKKIHADSPLHSDYYILCDNGKHYLADQIDEDGILIGLNLYRYAEPIKIYSNSCVMNINEWKTQCEYDYLTDEDGYGALLMQVGDEYYIVRDWFYPSEYIRNKREIPNHVTHVIWYNK